ncbi:MAG TPA: DinB family protein [Ignavibacteria bacterium]|nr:DinB family protein [Ignavibacteria bacterium]
MLEKIKQLPEKAEAVKFFSHLINCQYKWMARVTQDPKADKMDWWIPLYSTDELESKWNDSLLLWIKYLDSKTDEELMTEVSYTGYDGESYAASPGDIALQLNYHSIHHRANSDTYT